MKNCIKKERDWGQKETAIQNTDSWVNVNRGASTIAVNVLNASIIAVNVVQTNGQVFYPCIYN